MGECSTRAPSARCSFRASGLPISSCLSRQVERFEEIIQVTAGGILELTQAIVAAFISEGHFARHIQRMRKLVCGTSGGDHRRPGERPRRQHLGIDSQPGGMHLILRLQGGQSDRRLVARMREDRASTRKPWPDWMIGREAGAGGCSVGFTNIDSPGTAENARARVSRS